jgi:hypothetical protein
MACLIQKSTSETVNPFRHLVKEEDAIHVITIKTFGRPCHGSDFAGLSSCRPGFAPCSIHVGFVEDKVVLEQVSL